MFYSLRVRHQDPIIPLDRLLESFLERALSNNDMLAIGRVGEIEPTVIGGEEALSRRFEGVHRQSEQPVWGHIGAVTHGDRSYLILAMAPEQHQEAPETFQAITDSIRFTP
jgi:hypothetical protein